MDIAELKSKTLGELHAMAESLEIPGYSGLRKQRLVIKIQHTLLKSDVDLTAHGVLEILPEGYGFLRSSEWNYLPSPDDVYVGPHHIKRFHLGTGDTIVGKVRPPRRRERYEAVVEVVTVNGGSPEDAAERTPFDDLRPRYPDQRLRLETADHDVSMRVVDLFAPIGKGQRGLIVSPPKAGKTTLLQQIANSIVENHPEVALIVLLVDERPEEVTEFRQNIDGEVIASTFDEPAKRHATVSAMVLEKAKRLVESGRDVVILLDSITRLARAHNTIAPKSGKILSGGVEANALFKPKQFFGSARAVVEGGSLTIIATALVDTGSRMDEVIFEEFKGTGNMELVLDRQVADRRIFPAVDLNRSGTRKEELLLTEIELNRMYLLRNFCGDMPPLEAAEFLLERMKRYETNADFLDAMAQGG
ncbi:MAG: transcription termination factor Rho [Gemmatimonadetes bacterium]|nr:transcription termination factor Rho [Gemmatimonadota bacterium]NNF37825.1 transcription termination factor Rho [Gemmatimonadota bacterium]NNK64450.1 transcription termination factor Rho [Gemmatimonadota bacterium]